MDTRIRDEIGLELCDVHVNGAIESQGSGEGRDDLRYESVQVRVGWSLDV